MDVPLDLLVFHLVLPLAINRADPRAIVKTALRAWLRGGAWLV